jgi:hypothetical protein
LATLAAANAIPVNPSTAAISATTKKMRAHRNMCQLHGRKKGTEIISTDSLPSPVSLSEPLDLRHTDETVVTKMTENIANLSTIVS